MANDVSILGPNGKPLAPPKASMLAGGSRVPYDAADIFGPELASWQPYLWSPDGELNIYRDRIVSRVRDLVRNDGWASGAVTRTLDNAIGANFRPVSKPDYRALAQYTGNKAFDAKWADEFGRAAEANYRTWANDPGRYCDASRSMSLPKLFAVAFRHKLTDGDALAQMLWLPERVGIGRARYSTAVQLIDPDRLSNPQLRFDQMTMRGGVEVDDLGAATGYWIRRAHQGDWFSAAQAVHWDYIPRETSWGRPVIVHDFEHDRAGQHRGGAGILAPVLQRLKMLIAYDSKELEAAILNAVFSAYIESPFDQEFVEQGLGESVTLNNYQQMRSDFHEERRLKIGNARMPTLFPGESINTVTAARPSSNFAEFEGAVLRNLSAATGLSAQQVSNNWADVNYSSARGALLEAWKTLYRRRVDFGFGFGAPIWGCLLEEQFAVDNLPLPRNAPDFIECRAAYSAAKWMGPGRGWLDLVAERKGAILGMDSGLSTLEQECAENSGEDWEENLDQRAREIEAYRERGLTPPVWSQGGDAESTIMSPKAA
jgi:lambda family phage portal protein